jgi:hypothetical protein
MWFCILLSYLLLQLCCVLFCEELQESIISLSLFCGAHFPTIEILDVPF